VYLLSNINLFYCQRQATYIIVKALDNINQNSEPIIINIIFERFFDGNIGNSPIFWKFYFRAPSFYPNHVRVKFSVLLPKLLCVVILIRTGSRVYILHNTHYSLTSFNTVLQCLVGSSPINKIKQSSSLYPHITEFHRYKAH
jgi:hypothetical protein